MRVLIIHRHQRNNENTNSRNNNEVTIQTQCLFTISFNVYRNGGRTPTYELYRHEHTRLKSLLELMTLNLIYSQSLHLPQCLKHRFINSQILDGQEGSSHRRSLKPLPHSRKERKQKAVTSTWDDPLLLGPWNKRWFLTSRMQGPCKGPSLPNSHYSISRSVTKNILWPKKTRPFSQFQFPPVTINFLALQSNRDFTLQTSSLKMKAACSTETAVSA